MDKQTYEEVKNKFEKLKRDLIYLEKGIKNKKPKDIEKSTLFLHNLLVIISKKATKKGFSDTIKSVTDFMWDKQIKKDKRKYINVKKIYSIWAKDYDTASNLLVFLEEKLSPKYFGKIKGKNILDYGCGTGRYAIPLAKKGANVTAIDFSNAMLKRAKLKVNKKLKIEFKKKNIIKYNPRKKFDLIISMLVLDHIKNLKKVISIIDKASKKGTIVVISNIHPDLIYQHYIKTGKGQGFLIDNYITDQFYHPLEEYVDLFLEKGFNLIKTENINFEKKYYNIKRFKGVAIFKDRPVGIIMKFKKN